MSSSVSSSSFSSSSSSSSQRFDVFLSFRGPDTRRKFISFLNKDLERKGIRAFKDDTEVTRGEAISRELLQAIEDSKFAVVVVSENYAASEWCLKELVEILEFRKKGSLTVIPIFYEVKPSDLRRHKGKVAEHFKKHESRKDPEEVEIWKKALEELAGIRGECSLTWNDDSNLVDEITDRIAKELSPAVSSNGRNLVGINEHMKELYNLMDLNDNKVLLIGIWGRGGVGRSTLARYVYNEISQHFQSHCLLENVKGICSQHKSLSASRLRKEFLSKLQGEASSMKGLNVGSSAIKARLGGQRTLLVANDVDKIEQLDILAEDFNWFGPGSRVIITTQDKQLLASCGVTLVYEVELLRCYEVRQLFRQPAFKQKAIDVGIEPSSIWAMNLILTMKSYASLFCRRGSASGI